MKNILYITVHLGGGVGKAILGVVRGTQGNCKSTIVVLEQPEKSDVVTNATSEGIDIRTCPSKRDIRELLLESDIVVLNWWNHPLMASFLYSFPQVSCRMIVWSHINGCTYPYLPFDFVEVFDRIWFTSSYSYDNTYWTDEQRKYIYDDSNVIFGNGMFEPKKMLYKESYKVKDRFRIGYVGTLNYSKINKNYVKYCEKVVEYCSDVEFVLVGELDKELQNDIQNSKCVKNFICKGYAKDVEKEFLSFDVFGYILNEDNYGTTENVILEAMTYGIPIIAYDGGVERQIIDDGENGFLVNNEYEYAKCVEKLFNNKELRKTIGQNARRKVCRVFDSKDNLKKIEQEFEMMMLRNKQTYQFDEVLGDTPYEWFLKFTGDDSEIFQEVINSENAIIEGNVSKDKFRKLIDRKRIYVGERKSSIYHYFSCYKEDVFLNRLVEYVNKV